MEAKKQSTQLNQPQQSPQQLAEPEEHIDPYYLHYLRAIGVYDSFQQQSERGKGRRRKSRR
ncbi:unnamed protein product [Brassica oleracea var. botrytis]|uniref:(rape) hypothetical protein n=1 Tax=Brassica napus TaxID=3708 RepID=A0A816RHB2_BRANA|nr:unnamed protein product [Brassica napus]